MSRVVPFRALVAVPDEGCSEPPAVSFHAAVADARHRHRSLIAAAGRWSLSRGVSLPADHIALWAAAVADAGVPGDVARITGPWRVSHIPGLLETARAWCMLSRCHLPADFGASLGHLFGFLAATGRLHPDSDALPELRAACAVFAEIGHVRVVAPLPPEPSAA